MIHLPPLITDLGLILGAAAVITLLFKKLKQPLVLGYLIAGFLVGPHFKMFPTIVEIESVNVWAEIGVIVLLFSLGLEFSFKKLIRVGPSASITAVVEVLSMLFLGYLAGTLMGWSRMDSIFLGGVLSISSTTIIIRAFEELGLKGQKFAGLVFGILIVEDLVAIVLLVLLSTVAISTQFAGTDMLISIVKLVFFLILWFLSGIFFLPTLLRKTKKLMSDETLLIMALALCILMVWLATLAGFSPALGAFIMGSILAETTYAEKIEHLVKPVKDLFGAVFFVSVGMLIDPNVLVEYAVPVLVITLLTLVGKFLSSTLGALVSGQPLKTSVQTGMSLSQIGEFSFIIATLGLSLKVTSPFLYPIAVAVSAVTTFTTPYMIKLSDPFYVKLNQWLPSSWTAALTRYSNRSQRIKDSTDFQKLIRVYVMNSILLTVVIVAIILLADFWFMPFLDSRMDNRNLAHLLGLFVTFLFMSPFLWALVIKMHQKELIRSLWEKNNSRGLMVVLQLARLVLGVLLICFLIDRFYSTGIAISAAISIIAVLLVLSRKIQKLYLNIEGRFLSNYNERETAEANGNGREASALVPWDAHLTVYTISPEWNGLGKTLMELAWREKYGVNVASIERGDHTINIPPAQERIYPHDAISVIGTDEQLMHFGAELESGLIAQSDRKRSEVMLESFEVSEQSSIVHKTIRDSGIRQKVHGIVVGVERNGQRTINPEASWVIAPGDVLWIVGDKLRLLSVKRKEAVL